MPLDGKETVSCRVIRGAGAGRAGQRARSQGRGLDPRPAGRLRRHIGRKYLASSRELYRRRPALRVQRLSVRAIDSSPGVTSGRSSRRDRSCDEPDVADPEPVEPDPMSAGFGARRPRRGRGPMFHHPYCTINHRSPETAASCANSAPVRARREAAERRAAEIAAARAADKAAAKAARRSQRRQAMAAPFTAQ